MPVMTTLRDAPLPLERTGRRERDIRVTIIERVDSPADRVRPFGLAFAWGGALLFVFALAYFLYTYAFTFGENQQTSPAATAIGWDLGLFTAFALHHSVFAREHVRQQVARIVPPSLERSLYVWIASTLFIGVCALWRPVNGVTWQVPPPFGWLLYGALVTGAWLSVRSAGAIDIWELAGVRAVLTLSSQRLRFPNSQTGANSRPQTLGRWPNEDVGSWEFKTTGPYGVVRHPIYLGWFLMVFGVPTMTNTRLVFALVSCAYLLVAIPLEERSLRLASAGKYDEYIQSVRWRLFPGVY